MTLNLSTLVNLRYELESKFKQKLYEERSKVEERAKNLSVLAFTELYSFFDKLHAAALESELASIESDKTSFKSMIGKRFAEGSLLFSELLLKMEAKQQSKIDEYMTKKAEIESKILDLKNKITDREHQLDEINLKITNIDAQSAILEDPNKINELDEQIKSVQKDLEEHHKQTVNDIVSQKKVSEEVKSVAAEMVQQEVEKVKEVTQEAHKNDTGTVKPADQQTQQLVFEFAKETNEAIKETSTSAKIENSLVEQMDEQEQLQQPEKDPNQLEFDFMEEVEQPIVDQQNVDHVNIDQTAPTQPETNEQAEIISTTQTGESVKLEKNTETEKQDKEKVNANIQEIAEHLNVDKDEVNKVVEEVEQNSQVGIVEDKTETPAQAVETPQVQAATSDDTVKQKLQESVDTVKTVKQTSSEITENVDKKLSSISEDLTESDQKLKKNKENLETIEKNNTTAQEAGNIPENKENSDVIQSQNPQELPVDQKKVIIAETTNNLKEVAEKQKEVINVQKEALAVLEDSARKLIDGIAMGGDDVNQEDTDNKKTISLESLKELLNAAVEMLSELMEDLFEAIQGKKEQSKIKDIQEVEAEDKLKNSSTEDPANISSLRKLTSETEDQIKKVKTEVFYISGEKESVDKILTNAKTIANKADKIVVDRQLVDVFKKLSFELGDDKVVLDRRQGNRRETPDRRDFNNNTQENVFNSTIEQLNKIDIALTTEENKDTERRERSERRTSSDRRQTSPLSFMNIEELDEVLSLKNNNWPAKL